jgi:hypothetical protein
MHILRPPLRFQIGQRERSPPAGKQKSDAKEAPPSLGRKRPRCGARKGTQLVVTLGGTIKTDRRSIAAADFFQGMFITALEQGEIITSIEIPIPEKSANEKFREPPRATRSLARSWRNSQPARIWRSPLPISTCQQRRNAYGEQLHSPKLLESEQLD